MPSAKVRIGNWQEELAYEADKKALLKNARENGSTLSQGILAKVKHHRQEVDLQQPHPDGFLRFGVPVALQNADTNGCLATDLDDKSCADGDDRFACTTTRVTKPQLRAAWVMLPVPSKDDAFIAEDADPDVVHYGQRFVIQTSNGLANEPLFLSSTNKTHTSLSRVTSNQDVFLSANGGQKALWAAMHANAEYRPDMVGKPVKANSLLILVHQGTNVPLASTSGARVSNDFGAEFEVCCHRYLKVQSKSGNAPEQAANLWAAVTAPAE
jgi:hypothetical protein